MARAERDPSLFTPNEERSLLQLERTLEVERDARQLLRTAREADPNASGVTVEVENPSYNLFSPDNPNEPSHYHVQVNQDFLRGAFRISRSLYDNVIFDVHRNPDTGKEYRKMDLDKKTIADGIVEQYRRKP